MTQLSAISKRRSTSSAGEIIGEYYGRSVHLLACFLKGEPTTQFRSWVENPQASRKQRNRLPAQRPCAYCITSLLKKSRRAHEISSAAAFRRRYAGGG
jgi:hypothetical protein